MYSKKMASAAVSLVISAAIAGCSFDPADESVTLYGPAPEYEENIKWEKDNTGSEIQNSDTVVEENSFPGSDDFSDSSNREQVQEEEDVIQEAEEIHEDEIDEGQNDDGEADVSDNVDSETGESSHTEDGGSLSYEEWERFLKEMQRLEEIEELYGQPAVYGPPSDYEYRPEEHEPTTDPGLDSGSGFE